MALRQLLAAAALSLGLLAQAQAAADPAQFALTPALLQKLKAAEPDLKKLATKKDDDDEDLSDKTVEQVAKHIETVPGAKATLARHGITPLEYALSAHAMLHAGMHLMMESSMGQANAAKALAGYTPAQRANIELLRKSAVVKR